MLFPRVIPKPDDCVFCELYACVNAVLTKIVRQIACRFFVTSQVQMTEGRKRKNEQCQMPNKQ
jgi:hypothetical protein